MSQVEPVANEDVVALDDDDRVWLKERLAEYDELLTYLREH
jgi:predicted nucleic acid-binding Zn ribbon protein